MAAEGGRTMRAPADCIARSIGGTVTRLIGMLGPPDNRCVLTPLAANGLLQRVRSLLMLWTAPPPARKCHGCGCC